MNGLCLWRTFWCEIGQWREGCARGGASLYWQKVGSGGERLRYCLEDAGRGGPGALLQ